MATHEWYPRQRNYQIEHSHEDLPTEIATNHPLKSIIVTDIKGVEKRGTPAKGSNVKSGGGKKSDFVDPLSSLGPLGNTFEGSDPLSQIAARSESGTKKPRSSSLQTSNELDDTFEPWETKKAGILSKYTTSEKLSITTSFLSSADKEKVVIKAQTTSTVTDKVKNRLEQLDDFEDGSVQEMLNLSQQDYVKRIDELNQALISAWEHDQRVKALKIAIQCSKLLSDTSVIQFYPSKYVLITDILDTFGKLVYDRLKEKAVYPGSGPPMKLPDNFTPDMVPELAKETCRNWFFKIASIRELIPRFYVETAILKCYGFLNVGEYNEALHRLSVMTRGIGDPLVAIYARSYLSRIGIMVAPRTKDHLMLCFNDFLTSYPQVQGDSVQNILAMQKVEMPKYLTLMSPAVDWLLQCIANKSSEKTLEMVLQKSKKHCNSALMLHAIISAFKPDYIADRAVQFTDMIRDCEETGFPKHYLHKTLGLCLVMAPPPEDQRMPVLNEVWKAVMKLKNPGDYIGCAELWIEYMVKLFGKKEVNKILADIIKHMTPDRAFEDFYPQLQSVVSKILCHIHDFSLLFSIEKFLPFIDMFQKESVKVEVCKNVMEVFSKYQEERTNDPVIINALMFVCKTTHDSVNALTLEDEKKQISALISGFVRKISFGRDFEQQLSFYVECRSAFSNLDLVLVQLIQNVNNLAVETRRVVKGNHSRKTANFVRACAAYCFITIPSLQSPVSQLHLYLLSGQVALLNQCYSQADAFFKALISLIPDIPKLIEMDGKMRSTEPMVVESLYGFISTLLVVPDNPDSGVLYLVRGLLNIIQNYTWDQHNDTKMFIYTKVLAMLSAMSQEKFVYHVDKVDSNDALYGSDPKFLNELKNLSSTLVEEILNHLKTLAQPETYKRQSMVALELFNTIISHGDISQQSMFTLAVNLWGLARKHGQLDSKLMVRSLDGVSRKFNSTGLKVYSELQSKLPLESRA